MKYDILIVSAARDLDKADQVARRFRGLKFKVRLDRKRTRTTPSAKDLEELGESRAVLVLWSKSACDKTVEGSGWIYEMAAKAKATAPVVIQAALDRAVPDAPFSEDQRQALFGLAPRKPNRGFNAIAGLAGDACGRPGLKDWLGYTARNKDEKEAWKAAHPDDPLVAAAPTKPATEKQEEPAQGSEAATIPLAEVTEKSKFVRPTAAPLKLKPPVLPHLDDAPLGGGTKMLGAIGAGIAFLLVFSYFVKSRSASMPAIANARPVLAAPCPAGEIPAHLLATPPLAHGEIIDDTEPTDVRPPLQHGEIIDDTE